MPKIISECCKLVKLCHISRSGPVFLRHSVYFILGKRWAFCLLKFNVRILLKRREKVDPFRPPVCSHNLTNQQLDSGSGPSKLGHQ